MPIINTKPIIDSNITSCISYFKRQIKQIRDEEDGMFFVCGFHVDTKVFEHYKELQKTRKIDIQKMLKDLEKKENGHN